MESKIYSIAPRIRDCAIEVGNVRGLAIDKLPDYATLYVNKIKKRTGVVQDSLMGYLDRELRSAAEELRIVQDGTEGLRLEHKLSYDAGGTSSLGVAVFAIKKRADGLIDVAHAFYGEKWIEEHGVSLIRGRWPDNEIQDFLMYRLMSNLPAQYLK